MGINQESIEIDDPETGEVLTLTVTSLVSNVRDMVLMKIRNDKAKQVWSKMNEQEQAREIELAHDFARILVQSVASIVATRKQASIRALLDNFKVKDGAIIVTAKGMADDQALVALNHVGKKALNITVVDVEQFDEVRKPAEPDPDQGTMFNHDTDDDDGPNLADAMHEAIEGDSETGNADTTTEIDDTAGDLQPYEQGAGAAEHGLERTANPFDRESDDARHWDHGYKDWHDANPPAADEIPETETKEIGPEVVEETGEDGSGLTEMFDEVQLADEPDLSDVVEDAPTIEHDAGEFFDPKVYRQEGVEARVANKGKDENPYDGGTDEFLAWVGGWDKTDSEIDSIKAAGAQARRDGHSSKKNEYKAGTVPHKLWLEGYNAEKANEKD